MDEHIIATYVRPDPVFTHGHGAWLVDTENNEYLDMLGGIAVSALGHGHPGLVAALRDQVGQVLHTSNLARHPHTEVVGALLAKHTGLAASFFSNSGAEANECALKLARAWQHRRGATQRTAFVALEGGFHGRTLGALSVTSTPLYRTPFEPLIPNCHFVRGGDLHALEQVFKRESPAALILEPIQGESGLRVFEHTYLRAVRELCSATQTILIHDEVQSGCGRTGSFLAADAAGIKPDVVTLAKPLGAGVPIGATVVAESFAKALVPGDHGSTFGGGPLALRAARTFLELWDQAALSANVLARAHQLQVGLDQLVLDFDFVLERRGLGLMQGLRLKVETSVSGVVKRLAERRILACAAGDNVLRFLPPYVVTQDDIAHALTTLHSCLSQPIPCQT